MSLSRRKFMKAGVVAACAVLPLKSVLGQSGMGSTTKSLPSSSKINPEQLSYYTESSFTPYLNTQFSVYLSPSSKRTLKLMEVSDYLATLPKSVTEGNPQDSECFSLLFTISIDKAFEQDTYLIEHEALGSFYMFIAPVGLRGKTELDYYEAVFYRHPENSPQNNAELLKGDYQAAPKGLSVREAEVFYFRPQAIKKSSAATVKTEEPGAAGRRAAMRMTVAQAPGISGLKLGMTTEQVLALFPGSKDDADVRASLLEPPSQFGEQSLIIIPSKYSSEKRFDHVSQVAAAFLDGRVSSLYVGYDAMFWPHVDDFVDKFAGDAKLPGAHSWDAYVGMDTQLKTLKCKDFEISLFAGGNNVNINYAQMRDLTAQRKVKERRARARARKGAKQ